MAQEAAWIKLKVEWKLEKFDGDVEAGALPKPVEVISGTDFIPVKEIEDGTDERS